MADHTTLHINCQPEQKQKWMLSARASGMAFEDWVIQQLNAAAIDTNPAWMDGLSERARLCLLAARFNCRDSVAQAIAEGFDIGGIQNAALSIKNEIEKWVKNN